MLYHLIDPLLVGRILISFGLDPKLLGKLLVARTISNLINYLTCCLKILLLELIENRLPQALPVRITERNGLGRLAETNGLIDLRQRRTGLFEGLDHPLHP